MCVCVCKWLYRWCKQTKSNVLETFDVHLAQHPKMKWIFLCVPSTNSLRPAPSLVPLFDMVVFDVFVGVVIHDCHLISFEAVIDAIRQYVLYSYSTARLLYHYTIHNLIKMIPLPSFTSCIYRTQIRNDNTNDNRRDIRLKRIASKKRERNRDSGEEEGCEPL